MLERETVRKAELGEQSVGSPNFQVAEEKGVALSAYAMHGMAMGGHGMSGHAYTPFERAVARTTTALRVF